MKERILTASTISTRENFFRDEDLAKQKSEGILYATQDADNSSTYLLEKDRSSTRNNDCQYLTSPSVTCKRKCQNMSSRRRIRETAAVNHNERSSTFFRETKKRKPPEFSCLMPVQESETQAHSEAAARFSKTRTESTARKECSSKALVIPEVCGESDLTAENHMAEDSSRSSNNDGTSRFESVVESSSKEPSEEIWSLSILKGFHSFMDRHATVEETLLKVPVAVDQLHLNTSGKSKYVCSRTEGHDRVHDEGDFLQLQSLSCEGMHELADLRNRSSRHVDTVTEEWLQLGLASSVEDRQSGGQSNQHYQVLEAQAAPSSAVLRRDNTYDHVDIHMQNKATVVETASSREDPSTLEKQLAFIPSVQWPGHQCPYLYTDDQNGGSSSLSIPLSLCSAPIAVLNRCAGRLPIQKAVKQDLSLFYPPGFQSTTDKQAGFSALEKTSRRHLLGNVLCNQTRHSSFLMDSLQPEREQTAMMDDSQPGRDDDRTACSMENSGSLRGAGNAFQKITAEDLQLSKSQERAIQFHRDNQAAPSSLAALFNFKDDQGQIRFPWGTSADPMQRFNHSFVPTEEGNFECLPGSKTCAPTMMELGGTHREASGVQRQWQGAPNDWSKLIHRSNSSMQSLSPESQQPQSPSVNLVKLDLTQSSGARNTLGNESPDTMLALRRAIEKVHSKPQWSMKDPNPGSVVSRCMNGIPTSLVRGDRKLESFLGEPHCGIDDQTESYTVRARADRSRTSKVFQKLSSKTKSPNATLVIGNVSSQLVSSTTHVVVPNQKFHVLPAYTRQSNQPGIWFILQSAEPQTAENGLPQIPKSYLRVKDGEVPISTVKKYLVTKLGLKSESEVEITCNGQQVVSSLPIQHVRDVIWYSGLTARKDHARTSSSKGTNDQIAGPLALVHDDYPRPLPKDVIMILTYRRHFQEPTPIHDYLL